MDGTLDVCGSRDVENVNMAVDRLGTRQTVSVARVSRKEKELCVGNEMQLGLSSNKLLASGILELWQGNDVFSLVHETLGVLAVLDPVLE